MGWGDMLLASGKAKRLHEQTGDLISIGDGKQVLWFDLYDNVPYLSRKPARWYYSYPGHRGYYIPKKYTWVRDYRAVPAQIVLTDEEKQKFTGDYVVIEPNIKPGSSVGKYWGVERYQAVVDANPDLTFIQPIHEHSHFRLKGVEFVTTDIRGAAALVNNAKACVLPDGFLHHVAAATQTPAVVIWGGFAPPKCLGYSFHRNLSWGEPIGFDMTQEQGMEAMSHIPPVEVSRHLRELISSASA